jgi:large subunit ribosomal protein L13
MKLTESTVSAKPADHLLLDKKWYIVDANDVVLGKLAERVADVLRGRDKAGFTAHVDTGSFVVVINAEKIKLTGNKIDQKLYHRHTGYIGHLRTMTAREMIEKKPTDVIVKAVEGMLPKNKLSRQVIKKLKVYAGSEHPHAGQRPEKMEI